jgi:hypothetical protein
VLAVFLYEVHHAKKLQCHRNLSQLIPIGVMQGRIAKTDTFDKQIGVNMNEPAFPNEGFNGWGSPFQGMTLRDYFAAKAMYSLRIEDAILHSEDCDFSTIYEIAESAYQQADAMLKARGE